MPTHYRGTEQEILALNTFIKLTRAVDSLETRLTRCGSLQNLTMSQFGVLEMLYHLGPLSQGVISEKMLKSGGNITLVIDNLEKRGWVRRLRDTKDRRVVMVFLTPAGEERIRQVLPGHIAAIVAEMNMLTPEEQALLGRLCQKLGLQFPDSADEALPG